MLAEVPPVPDLSIRPLAIGEVIDRALALTRRHFKTLFLVMLLVQAPALALYRSYAIRLQGAAEAVLARPGRAPEGLYSLAVTSAALLATIGFLQLAATAVAATVVAPSLERRPDGAAPSHTGRAIAARAWPIASAALLQLAALALAPALGAAPGLLLAWRAGSPATRVIGAAAALLGGTILFLAALLRLVLAPAAAGVEGLTGLRALSRSARLMSRGRGFALGERPGLSVSILLFATFLLALAVNGLAGLPRALAALFLHGRGLGLGPALPLWVEIAVGAFEALANAAVQPFSLVALSVFYFDRRARREGLDLEMWADGLGPGQREKA
jgi:hypothetical protein